MTYIVFLAVLAVAGLLYLLARLFRIDANFFEIFKALGICLVMLPIYVWSVAIVAMVLGVAFGGVVLVLHLMGLLPYFASMAISHMLPWWAWLSTGVVVFYGVAIIRDQRAERTNPSPPKPDKLPF